MVNNKDELNTLSHTKGIVDIMLYLRQSIEEKYFMMQEDLKL